MHQQLLESLEQTLLKPTATQHQHEQLIKQAEEFSLRYLCVMPYWLKWCKRNAPQSTQLVTVVGFPFVNTLSEVRLQELELAIRYGATELDMVMNMTAFKSGSKHWVKVEVAQFAKAAHAKNCMLKVIIETAYLSNDEIVEACKLCADAGADYVKTSTGFAPSGAEVEHVKLMRQVLPGSVGVKASGGIKTLAQAREMLAAGAERIGTSSADKILQEISG
jgi:deoxyribose-phosphate aldolase